MAICEMCGNNHGKSFQVIQAGTSHTFDSFECAIHMLAPICAHRGCRIIGHGLESDGVMYCCTYCARQKGKLELQDRA